MLNISSLSIKEIESKKPGIWFKYEVWLGNKHIADFETQIDRGYNLDGRREAVYTIYKIIVDREYRNKGVGTQIIRYSCDLARKESLSKVVCWIRPLDENMSEINLMNFYKSCGMRIAVDKVSSEKYAVKDL